MLPCLMGRRRNWAQDETPPVPLPQTTSSCVYMLLLLDAAGLLQARARNAWPVHLRFAPWWHGLARPFLSVRSVRSAVKHRLWGAPSTSQFLVWCSQRAAQITSLAALFREVGDFNFYRRRFLRSCWVRLERLLWHAYSMTRALLLTCPSLLSLRVQRPRACSSTGVGLARHHHSSPVEPLLLFFFFLLYETSTCSLFRRWFRAHFRGPRCPQAK